MHSSIFSNFCNDDMQDFIQNLPPSLADDTNFNNLDKPQQLFMDFRNKEVDSIQLGDLQKVPDMSTMIGEDLEFIDDTQKLKKLIFNLQDCRTLMVSCLSHYFRANKGFICYLLLRTQRGYFIIDALALRQQLVDETKKLNFKQILTNSFINKIICGGPEVLRMLANEFAIPQSYITLKGGL
jgi:hypothetical protein